MNWKTLFVGTGLVVSAVTTCGISVSLADAPSPARPTMQQGTRNCNTPPSPNAMTGSTMQNPNAMTGSTMQSPHAMTGSTMQNPNAMTGSTMQSPHAMTGSTMQPSPTRNCVSPQPLSGGGR